MKYRRKPVEVEARQALDLANHTALARWVEAGGGVAHVPFSEPRLYIESADRAMTIEIGDWVIKEGPGRFTVCPEDDFAKAYEPAT